LYIQGAAVVIIAPVPHLNKSLARSNKNPFNQGFLTGIVTINLREFFYFNLYIQGGEGTLQEICLTFLMYYPKQQISTCGSLPGFVADRDDSLYTRLSLDVDR